MRIVIPFTFLILSTFALGRSAALEFDVPKPSHLAQWQLKCGSLSYAKERVLTEKHINLRQLSEGQSITKEYERELQHYQRTLEQALTLNDQLVQSENAQSQHTLRRDLREVKQGLEIRRQNTQRVEAMYHGFLRRFQSGQKREKALSADYLRLKAECHTPSLLNARR